MAINRKAKIYEVECPECKKSRLVTYAQNWNIEKGNSSGKCKGCCDGRNVDGLEKGHGWNKGLPKEQQPCYGKINNRMVGQDNPAWKEDSFSYTALHQWVARHAGKATKCRICGYEGKCSWANIDHSYKRDLNDFVSMCYSCHKLYDLKNNI